MSKWDVVYIPQNRESYNKVVQIETNLNLSI